MVKGKKITAIIVAAGKGTRFGSKVPKQFLKIGDKTILEKAVREFSEEDQIDDILIVTSREYEEYVREMFSEYPKVTKVIPGGKERQDSVYNGLKASKGDILLIHDGARPFVKGELIRRVIDGALRYGAAVPVVNPKDSIRTTEGNLNRDELFMIQTPQGFKREVIISAYEKAMTDKFYGTDEGGIIEYAGFSLEMVHGDYENIKITTKEDLPVMETKVGMGFDVHKLVEGRKCILMGVEIPYEKGLLGHSDADVAVHALMDAMLGAAGLGDIGRLFPDNDPQYSGISSMKLLREVRDRICSEGYSIVNADITIICEKPKVSPYIEEMREVTSKVLDIEKDRINIKGTTTERLGFTGRGEGIASQAVCTLQR
ncbi:MAG: 2-C-methyl-D-erythritol 2,4-cyclodiphosphate synthase [Firmicutes bacterium]|nr:2-C-methyl-D-erythritol 2,4-cyclodiphosphate synthase [Bacillota bacterium]